MREPLMMRAASVLIAALIAASERLGSLPKVTVTLNAIRTR
jgi:hypothetical protein